MLNRLLTITTCMLIFSGYSYAQEAMPELQLDENRQLSKVDNLQTDKLETSKAYQFSKLLTKNPELIKLYSLMEGVSEERVERRLLSLKPTDKRDFKSGKKFKMTDHKMLSNTESYNWDGTNKLDLRYRSFHSDYMNEDSLVTWRDYYQQVYDSKIEDTQNYLLHGDLSTNRILNLRSHFIMENGEWQYGYDDLFEVNDEGQTTSWSSRSLNEGSWNYNWKRDFDRNTGGYLTRLTYYIHEFGSWQYDYRNNFTYTTLGSGETVSDSTLSEYWDSYNNEWVKDALTEYFYSEEVDTMVTSLWNEISSEWYNDRRQTTYYDENGLDTLYLTEGFDTTSGEWYNKNQEVSTYNGDGNITEFYFQAFDTTSQEWINLNRSTYSWDGDKLAGRVEYNWDEETNMWVKYYENERTFNPDNTTATYTYKYYNNDGNLSYGIKEEYDYDSETNLVLIKSWEIDSQDQLMPISITERTFTSENMDETELLGLGSVEDVPNDQGGYVQLTVDGLHATQGAVDLNTGELKVWRYNGNTWENVRNVTYESNLANEITVDVPYTQPIGADSADYANMFQVTAHTQKGAFLSATGIEAGVALDNIAPAKVNGVTATTSESDISFDWDPNSSSDVDGYYLFEKSDDDSYPAENSLGFSEATNISIQKPAEEGDYEYVVVAVDKHNNVGQASEAAAVTITTGNELSSGLPEQFDIYQNYPNPFNPSTEIKYAVPEKAEVTVEVFNTLGKRVATLVNEQQTAGYHTVTFNASNLTSGMYFYRISSESFNKTLKMMLIK